VSAIEIISEIKKLPSVQRKKVFRFVETNLRAEQDRIDNEIADRALKKGEFVSWEKAKKELGLK